MAEFYEVLLESDCDVIKKTATFSALQLAKELYDKYPAVKDCDASQFDCDSLDVVFPDDCYLISLNEVSINDNHDWNDDTPIPIFEYSTIEQKFISKSDFDKLI